MRGLLRLRGYRVGRMCNRRGAYAAQGGKGTVQGFGTCYAGILSQARDDCKGFLSIFYGFMVFQQNIQESARILCNVSNLGGFMALWENRCKGGLQAF